MNPGKAEEMYAMLKPEVVRHRQWVAKRYILLLALFVALPPLANPVPTFAVAEITIGTNASWTTGTGVGICGDGGENVCIEGTSAPTGFVGCWCTSPTFVELVSFSAEHKGGHVLVKWTTAAEIDNAGFHLWRSESRDAGYERLTSSLIPAEGGVQWGAEDTFEDTSAKPNATYYYMLEDLDYAGNSTFHGPASAVPASPFGCSMQGGAAHASMRFVPGEALPLFALLVPCLLAIIILKRKCTVVSRTD